MEARPIRVYAIDLFRAVTMFLMVFINDLDGVADIPEQWKHAAATEDRLGFADTIFPAFLFIVGLSLPFALQGRMAKNKPVIGHILVRTLALLIMGFFHVNLESYGIGGLLSRPVWEILITIAFFLVWLKYDREMAITKRWIWQGFGIALLCILAFLFHGNDDASGPLAMHTSWWGILGLIGWAYLPGALVYYFSKGNLAILVVAWIFFFGFNLANQLGWLSGLDSVREYVWISSNGGLPSLVIAGSVVAVLYQKMSKDENPNHWAILMTIVSIALFVAAFVLRPFGGISKIQGTPAWIAICTAISLAVFIVFVYLQHLAITKSIFGWLEPAGTSTLTCYLIPYLLYPIFELIHFHYPVMLAEGIGGFIRSVLVAVFCVMVTGVLQRKKLTLKI